MSLLIISASLNPASKSRRLAQAASAALTHDGITHTQLDLRDFPLPLCDGGSAYADSHVAQATQLISTATGIIVASPIYNYDVNAALKNLLELTGKSWLDKTVSFLVAAGGQSSYMSVMGVANSLMLDFRCVIVPRFVYAAPGDFDDNGSPGSAIIARVEACARATALLVRQRGRID